VPFLCFVVQVAGLETAEFIDGGGVLGGSHGQAGRRECAVSRSEGGHHHIYSCSSCRQGEELRLNPYSNRLLTVIGPASLSYLARGKLTVDWDYARAMAASLRPMDRGYLVVQEPALLEGPTSDLLSELSDALRSMRPPGVKTIMMVYFKPFSLAYEMLLDVAVDGLWLDCVSDPGWLTAIKEKGGRNITVLGLMDSRNTLLEKPSSLAGSLVSGSQTVAGDVFLAPNWGFDILPYPVAKQKTRLLGQALKEAS